MLNKKTLGVFAILISILFLITIIIFIIQLNNVVDQLMELSGGNCFIDGVCAHQQNNFPVYIGIFGLLLNLVLGIYLIFFDKSEKEIKEYITKDKESKQKEEGFEILLKGLDEAEKKVIQKVKEQDGISQSTLRIRTDMSKAKLSMVLADLEKKGLIKKVQEGKFNKIFLKIAL